MESDLDRDLLTDQLREAERGAVAPWVSYPPVPWWYAPAYGAWATTYTLTLLLDGDAVRTVLQALHVVAMIAAIALIRRWRGTYPRGRAPRELNAPFALLVGGALVVLGVVSLLFQLVSPWLAAVAAFVLATLLVQLYERRYAAAAQRVRERLA